MVNMAQFAGSLVWFKNTKRVHFVPKKFGKKIMAEFMKWRADPRGPQYAAPANRAIVFFLRPFLQF